jgi:hypothetical protein
MPDIKAAITKPIGPLPAFAWVLVIVGGYFGYKFISGRSGSSSSSSSTATPVGTSSGAVAPSSSDYAALTSQISTLGNQITNLGSQFPKSPAITPLPTPPPIAIGPPSTQPPVIASLTGFWSDKLGNVVDNLGNVYSGVVTGSGANARITSYKSSSGKVGVWSNAAGPNTNNEPIFTLSSGTILRPMGNLNASDWWTKYIASRISNGVPTPGVPSMSAAPIPGSTLNIPAMTPVG